MTSKKNFLKELKWIIEKKTINEMFLTEKFKISKKLIKSLINKIFSYLYSDNVYSNILDTNLEKLIIKDLINEILNFKSTLTDYVFMSNFKDSIRQVPNKERDRLMEFLEIFDFESLRPLLESKRKNKEKGGRPGYDVILMFKILFLKAYYNLADEKIARRIKSDEVCQCFLNYPEKYPCKSTIWNFRDKLTKKGLCKNIWEIFKYCTMIGKYSPKKFVMQDACFYTTDKGQKTKNYPRGELAKSRRSRDGEFMTKNKKTVFGYKLHTKQDCNTQLITDFRLTPANIHDSQINLCKKDEIDYKDKAYFKKKYIQFNGRMTRAVRDHPLIIWEKLRNKRITRKRAPVERPYSFLDRINKSHTKLTTKGRNNVMITILMMMFNIEQLITLKNPEKIKNAQEENERDDYDFQIPFKFFNNSIYYYSNFTLINFLVESSKNKEIKKYKKQSNNVKKNKNAVSMSKSDYRRKIKRNLGKIRKEKTKTLENNYKIMLKTVNEFNLNTIEI